MVKKSVDLKKRLDALRHEPEPPVGVTLHLDANLYRLLTVLAAQERVTLEAYLVKMLNNHTESMLGDAEE